MSNLLRDKVKQYLEKLSSRSELELYLNNLDELLNIKTVNSCHLEFGTTLCRRHQDNPCHLCNINCDNVKELTLTNNELAINDKDFDWYIIAKKENRDYFRFVGLNKKNEDKGVVYELGNSLDPTELNKVILKRDENGYTNLKIYMKTINGYTNLKIYMKTINGYTNLKI